jgi:hypothetical protein
MDEDTYDLSEIDVNAPAPCELKRRDGSPWLKADGSPVTITAYASDSEPYRKAQHALLNRRITQNKGRRDTSRTSEEIEAENVELFARVTVGWDGLTENGQPLEFNRENARRLYATFLFIREQVEAFTAERANFTKTVSSTSSTTHAGNSS